MIRVHYKTALPTQIRGDSIDIEFDLPSGYTEATFTGGIRMVFRPEVVDPDPLDDTGALLVLSTAGGDITFSGSTGSMSIQFGQTVTWPRSQPVYWALQGTITGPPLWSRTIDSGTIRFEGDIAIDT